MLAQLCAHTSTLPYHSHLLLNFSLQLLLVLVLSTHTFNRYLFLLLS